MSSSILSQCDQIRSYLLDGQKITPIEALNFFGCMRLGARIWDLRNEGLSIQSRTKQLKNNKKVAEYYMLESEIRRIKNQSINPSVIQ